MSIPASTIIRRNTATALLAFLAACRPVPVAEGADTSLLYAAVLETPGLLRYDHRRALERHLMSDSGTYERSGLLPDGLVAFLMTRHVISEVCRPLDSDNEVPECQADSARGELRVSRPVPLGDTAVIVFVGQVSIRDRSDTSRLFLGFATTHRCRLTRLGTTWKAHGCDLYMIT
jgi:hypothetical protein